MDIPWWAVLGGKLSDPITAGLSFLLGLFARSPWHVAALALVGAAAGEGLLYLIRGAVIEITPAYVIYSYAAALIYAFGGFVGRSFAAFGRSPGRASNAGRDRTGRTDASMRPSSRWEVRTRVAIGVCVAAVLVITVGFLLYDGDNFRIGPQAAAVDSGGQAGSGPMLADPDRPPANRMTHPAK
jgi:hypothetical protein